MNFHWWNEYLTLQHMILLNIMSTRLTKFKTIMNASFLNLEYITHVYNKRAARGQRPTATKCCRGDPILYALSFIYRYFQCKAYSAKRVGFAKAKWLAMLCRLSCFKYFMSYEKRVQSRKLSVEDSLTLFLWFPDRRGRKIHQIGGRGQSMSSFLRMYNTSVRCKWDLRSACKTWCTDWWSDAQAELKYDRYPEEL